MLSPSQVGFRKNYRTTEHIFTLFNLIKKAFFVEFQKAYDSICRKRLFYRSEETGMIGKILDIIEPMYKSLKISLIHQDKTSQTFLTTIGLK